MIVVLVVAAGLTGAAITSAFSRGPGPGFGPGFGPGHWHGGMMGESFDPAQAEERADRAVRHMAIELDATDAQQDKLRAVAKAAVKDLIPLREKVQSARLKARELPSPRSPSRPGAMSLASPPSPHNGRRRR